MYRLWRMCEILFAIGATAELVAGVALRDTYYIAFAALLMVWAHHCHTMAREAK